jgi:hypothetical protein
MFSSRVCSLEHGRHITPLWGSPRVAAFTNLRYCRGEKAVAGSTRSQLRHGISGCLGGPFGGGCCCCWCSRSCSCIGMSFFLFQNSLMQCCFLAVSCRKTCRAVSPRCLPSYSAFLTLIRYLIFNTGGRRKRGEHHDAVRSESSNPRQHTV